MTVIRYSYRSNGRPVATLHRSIEEAVLEAQRDDAETSGIEVLPAEGTWDDPYVVAAGSEEWRRLVEAVKPAGASHQIRAPGGAWVDLEASDEGTLTELRRGIGPGRVKPKPTE